jgi:nucleotide-binding universal stress UspA family protein
MFLSAINRRTDMAWDPIVVGVDTSPAAARAAKLGLSIAAAAGVSCRLVHATRDRWSAAADMGPTAHAAFRAAALHAVRERVTQALRNEVPQRSLRDLVVREGWAPAVLDDEVREAGAGLLVLGAKHHSVLGRWLGGSTVHNVARMLRVPLLVAGAPAPAIRRVLVAVDASAAARPTLEAARRFTDLGDAELRAIHVIEPLPIVPELPPETGARDYERLLEEECLKKIWPLVPPDAERVIRHAAADTGIAAEAKAWQADLVVVGSHGKGWVDRMLLGSITERLLNHLPSALLLVVPAGPTEVATPARSNEGAVLAGVH